MILFILFNNQLLYILVYIINIETLYSNIITLIYFQQFYHYHLNKIIKNNNIECLL